ncbi:DUF4352 domain-containing protein [Streptomyces sp. CAU 1734]|uniref:DUF4352 domain-containing protein n=1 Tax=Streptomyces sp. CAU 1734 TaxID=3140360 RepID=UPI0032617261
MRQMASVLLVVTLAVSATACRSVLPGFPAGKEHRAAGGSGTPVRSDAKAAGGGAAWVGDSVDIGGRVFGERLRVSVLGYVDPAVPADPGDPARATDRPAAGERRVGVDVALINIGGKPYDASAGASWVLDAGGKRHPAVVTRALTTGAPLKWNTVAAGEHRAGWLVFELPEKSRVNTLHVAVGKRTLVWQLGFPPIR